MASDQVVKFDIPFDPEFGRRLRAARAINAGESIFTERSFAFAPVVSHLERDCFTLTASDSPSTEAATSSSASTNDTEDEEEDEEAADNEEGFCFHCLRTEVEASEAIICSGCKYAFCSARCKDLCSPIHQLECPLVTPLLKFAAEQNSPVDDLRYLLLAVRTLIQAHLHRQQLQADPDALANFPSSSTVDTETTTSSSSPNNNVADEQRIPYIWANEQLVLSLQGNANMHRSYQPELLLNARKLANVLLGVLPAELLTGYRRQELIRLFLLFNVNCYALGEFGVALFFFGALASHSCAQNAAFVDDEARPGCKTLRALRPIEAGQEITVSYISTDLVMPTFLRRKKLLSTQLFWCQCPRCVDATEQDRQLRCVRCSKCSELAMYPLPTQLAPPPPRETKDDEEDGGDNGDNEDDDDGDNSGGDDDDRGAASSSSSSSASATSASSAGSTESSSDEALDRPDADEVWECHACKVTSKAADADSPRIVEQRAEELFLAARRMLLNEEGSLSPASVDPAVADKATKLLAFSLQNRNLSPNHYLVHMSRELLHAVYLERQMLVEALEMADSLLAASNRIYPSDHFEKAQLLETLAQLCTDTIQALREKSDDSDPSRFQTSRQQFLSAALAQYTTYLGPNSTPCQRLTRQLADLDQQQPN